MAPTLGIGIGPMEIGMVLAIVVLVFGTGKLAGVGKALGTSINDLKGALKEGKEEKKEEEQEKVEKTEAKPEETKPVEANAEETD